MNVKLKTIQAAMRAAATRGFDPLNSHAVQAEMLQRYWRMNEGRVQFRAEEQRRHRSEARANQELSALLRRQAGDAEHYAQWCCSGDGEFSPE